jgi:nucleoside-diphosphate-sugar epimerase/predicted dehydrogenase
VLIEKPLALDLKEATALYELAERQGVALCAMHNHMYDPWMERARALVSEGSVGEIMNVESYYGLNTRIPAFREYPAPNILPWLYTLPGGVYHDFLAHPLYVLLDYTGRPREVKVMKRSHGVLPRNMPDEIKIVIDGERAFGTVTLSFAAQPHQHFLKVYGSSGMVEVDFNSMTMVSHPASPLPKAAQKVIYNLSDGLQRITQTFSNVYHFLRGTLKRYHGMKVLIHRFYDHLNGEGDLPVSKDQALGVIRTMDAVWRQLRPEPLTFAPMAAVPGPRQNRVLVTGGTGFLGRRLIAGLVQAGYPVRVLARKLSNIEPLKRQGVEIFFGDVADLPSLAAAFEGVHMVIHAAAGTSGGKEDCERGTLQGTRNVLELCERRSIAKLVYISSCSVYGVADYKTNQRVTEEAHLERFPGRRGDYSASKQAAEDLVRWAMERKRFPVVVLRPGTIYGPGGDLFSPMMGLSLANKLFVVFGMGSFVLPYVYIDNLVDAIVASLRSERANNQILNIVDDHGLTKSDYVRTVIRRAYPDAHVIRVPLALLFGATAVQELLFGLLKRRPVLTRYRLRSSQRSVIYDSSKAREMLPWSSRVRPEEAADAIVRSLRGDPSAQEQAPAANPPDAVSASL